MQNSTILFTFFFRSEISFLRKFGPKTQYYQFKLEFGIYTNSNMQDSMVMFAFSILDEFGLKTQNCQSKVKLDN